MDSGAASPIGNPRYGTLSKSQVLNKMEVWLGMIGLGAEGIEMENLQDQSERDQRSDRDWKSYANTHSQFSSSANWAPMGKGAKGQPLADYIAILQDRYRDELQCRKCSGKGHSIIVCRVCEGRRTHTVAGVLIDCKDCVASDFDSPAMPKATGYVPCSDCRGTGQAAAAKTLLVAKTDTAAEPSTGVIMSIGPEVTRFSIGERVLYSQFAGIGYECEGRQWRVMKETYPIMRIKGTGDVKVTEG